MATRKPQSKRGDGSKQPNVGDEDDGAPRRAGMPRDGAPRIGASQEHLREGRWRSWTRGCGFTWYSPFLLVQELQQGWGLTCGLDLAGRAFGTSFSLIVALLLRSAPYPYWEGQFSKLLDGIRGGYTEKHYSLSVADCPGLFLCVFLMASLSPK